MVDVYFFNFDKRLNSTAQPDIQYGTKLECVYKDNTSILSPALRLQLSSRPTYNYFKIENRYYWITDIISLANDRWEITGSVDVLGTFKSHIQATSAFVLYDSTANTQLPDSRLGIETDCDTYTAKANMPWHYTTGTSGTYFIATTGEKDYLDIDFTADLDTAITGQVRTDQRNGTGVYAIPYSSIEEIGYDLNDFWTELMHLVSEAQTDSATYKTILDNQYHNPSIDVFQVLATTAYCLGNMAVDSLVEYPLRFALLLAQQLLGGGNALQNVKASYWLPFTVPDAALNGLLHTTNKLALGTYTDIVSNLKRVSDPIITSVVIPVDIPWHFHDWRDVTCTEIMLYVPLIGCINIPPEVVKGNSKLDLRFALNLYSGELACEVLCNGGEIATYGANCAMNILIGDSNINMGGIVNTVAAGVTKNFGAMAGSIVDTLSGMSTSVGGIGGGAGTGLTNEIVCICRCHETSQNPSALLATIGTPTRQLKTLSGSGFVQCLNAQLNCGYIAAEPYPTQTEIERVNNFLNTGVYLE